MEEGTGIRRKIELIWAPPGTGWRSATDDSLRRQVLMIIAGVTRAI
jgi:hypothetical protein